MDQQPVEPELTATAPASPYDPEMKEAGQLTSPTWELELFLSGALVFATFQLPDLVEKFFHALEPHVAGVTRTVVLDLSLYAKSIAYTLLITFTVHLVGRAQWVALMGLQSVFPKGIRWDELKIGPIARRMYERRTPSLGRVIAVLDNFCSIIFSMGMMFVVLFLFSATIVGVTGGLGWLLSKGITGGRYFDAWFLGIVAIFVAIPLVSGLLDRKLGPKLAPDSTAYRVISAALRFSFALNFVRSIGPMMWVLMSNIGRRKAVLALYAGLMGIIFVSTVDVMVRRGAVGLNNYDYYGPSVLHGVASAHYENQRKPDANPREPMIQSDIIRDPYVRLFIPYSPGRHNAALAQACPGLKPLQAEGLQVGGDTPVPDSLAVPALRCIAKVHDVKLDGAPIPNLDFAFYEHPATGLRGVVAYIAVDSLPRGRHVLTVMPAPPVPTPTDSADLADARWKQPYVIPFWK
jgi:hypothetical protein